MKASNKGAGETQSASVLHGDKQAEEDLWQRNKAEHGIWSEKMLKALERGIGGNKWFSLIDKVYAERTLGRAWEKVRSNAGACGVDGITVERFAKTANERLLVIKEQLRNGNYQPKPVKRAWIPKAGSEEQRPLGIPTVQDRIVQTALRMVIEPIFERRFNDNSHGFRPGRGCKDALRRVDKQLKGGYTHVVDVDIKGYFDAIEHAKLLSKITEHISDGKVIELISGFLKAGVMEELEVRDTRTGTPQGGTVSPMLANIYLNDLDWLMQASGHAMTRYADDMVVLCKSPAEAQQALDRIRQWMEAEGLTLHPTKTRIIDMNRAGASFDFLGYRFYRNRKGRILRLIRPKSVQKMKESLRPITRRNNRYGIKRIIERINPQLKGWFGYFKQADFHDLTAMDQWVRQRLRAVLRRQKGKRGISKSIKDDLQWNIHYFDTLGLFNLKTARTKVLQSLNE